MADRKRILIIDDNFEIALFLRTTLEIIWPAHEVINVPSGEEGLLEVRRGRPDVVILDLKLPGIQGLEFVDKIERLAPGTPIIVITGERSPELHQQVRARGVAGFFLKPLHVDDISSAVRQILEGAPAPDEGEPPLALSPQITRRLSSLRIDTGADYVMLVDYNGRCLAADGQAGDLNTGRLALLLAGTLANSAELAQALRAPQPFTISYQAGTTHDLYAASVGAGYVIALVFDAHHGRAKIGAVWVYARRAIKELLDLLGSEPPPPAAVHKPAPVTSRKPVAAPRPAPAAPTSSAATPKPAPAGRAKREPEAQPKPEPEPVAAPRPAPAAAEREPAPAEVAETPEEGVVYSPAEVDAFWDSVLSEEEGEGQGQAGFSGLTLQEARARGLIPTDFDPL
jgi:DNA-binding NarL/FixJ family response regulator